MNDYFVIGYVIGFLTCVLIVFIIEVIRARFLTKKQVPILFVTDSASYGETDLSKFYDKE